MMEALSPANIGLLLFGIFFVLLLIGSPIMVALGVATMACFIVLAKRRSWRCRHSS